MEAIERVPRDAEELEAVLRLKPAGWEYLLFAGYLFLGKQRLELRWRDHEVPPYAPKQAMDEASEATTYLSAAFNRISDLIAALTRVFPPEVQAQAFGEPGEPGDPIRIEHFATRIVQTYEALLDWAASLRAVEPPAVLQPAFETGARMADQPMLEIRQFIEDSVRETDRIPTFVANHDEDDAPLEIRLDLILTMDEAVSAEFHRRLKRANRKLRWGV
jgi:hypothetical protein